MNIKRLAYEIRPATSHLAGASSELSTKKAPRDVAPSLPKAPERPFSNAIPASTLSERIDAFLTARGYRAGEAPIVPSPAPAFQEEKAGRSEAAAVPVDFVCEDDVREALKTGRTLLIGEKTIITPAARDLGEAARVFVYAGWPR